MTAEHPTDVLPIMTDGQAGFEIARRGYDRSQVDSFIDRLDGELAAAIAERDAMAVRTADLAAQLASAQAQIESLRRQLHNATETVNADNVDARIRGVLDAASSAAAAIRSSAQADADALHAGAADAAAATRANALAEAERIVTEAGERHAQAEETLRRRTAEVEATAAKATAERQTLDAEAAAERERLDAESRARRAQAEEDFEIALRKRRTAELAESARIHAEAEATATQMVAEATARVQRLEEYRNEVHGQLEQLHARLRIVIDEAVAARQSRTDE